MKCPQPGFLLNGLNFLDLWNLFLEGLLDTLLQGHKGERATAAGSRKAHFDNPGGFVRGHQFHVAAVGLEGRADLGQGLLNLLFQSLVTSFRLFDVPRLIIPRAVRGIQRTALFFGRAPRRSKERGGGIVFFYRKAAAETGMDGSTKEVKALRWHLVRLRLSPRRLRPGPWLRSLALLTAGFCLVALFISWVPNIRPPQAVPAFAPAASGESGLPVWVSAVLERYPLDYTAVLHQGLPLAPLRAQGREKDRLGLKLPAFSLRGLGLPGAGGPLAFFKSELALFGPLGRGTARPTPLPPVPPASPAPPAPPSPGEVPAAQPPVKPAQAPTGPPVVAVYHTHTSEDYVPTAGTSHTYNRKAGIVVVGETLVEALAEHGIRAVHDTTRHDGEKFREAYLHSADTAARLVKANSGLKMLLDVHRDAPSTDPGESHSMTTAEIAGRKVARLYLIVGTDRLGLAHPNWQKNHAFALKLQQKLESLYPGLSRGIKIDTARFNQHLHPQALLVEIGGDQNTLEEAKLAARYLADAIAVLLPELP